MYKQRQVFSYFNLPTPSTPSPPSAIPTNLPSHRYSGQHRNVLVKGMVLEHAFGDENVLDLPQDVLAEVAPHDLQGSECGG